MKNIILTTVSEPKKDCNGSCELSNRIEKIYSEKLS